MSLRSDWQDQVAARVKDIGGIDAIRFHGMLDDDMSVLLRETKAGPVYSFASIDASYDNLLAAGIKPYVELSFMPAALASNASATVFHYKGGTSPPADMGKWAHLITALITHLEARYGAAEVRSWDFEVWNEPNCGFWSGDQAQYFALYKATATAIKAVDPQLRVGGPSTCQAGWLPDFLAFVRDNKLPIDFLSTHLYPTDPQVPKTRTGFVDVITNATRVAASAGLPLVVSEYNAGLGAASDLDGSYAAAFVVHAISHLKDSWADLYTRAGHGFSYWSVSDVFEEGGMEPSDWHNGYGITTVRGVPKPAARAFELLNALTGAVTAVDISGADAGTVDAIGTVDAGAQQAHVIASNWAPVSGAPAPNTTATLTFTNACCGTAAKCPKQGALVAIDAEHGDARALWQSWGSPTYPSQAQVAQMTAASQLTPQSVPLTVVGAGAMTGVAATAPLLASGVLMLSVQLPACAA